MLTSQPGGGGTPLYKLYRYVPPQRVWFLSRFGLKTGIDFDHYGLKSGMVFEGTTGAHKRICLFNGKLKSRERDVSKIYNSSWILPILDFVTDAKLNYDTTKVWKRVWILEARSENGCGKRNILVWNWVRIWGSGRHTPTKNSEEYSPPGLPNQSLIHNSTFNWLQILTILLCYEYKHATSSLFKIAYSFGLSR